MLVLRTSNFQGATITKFSSARQFELFSTFLDESCVSQM